MRSTKTALLVVLLLGMTQFSYSQRGKDGSPTYTTANNIVNTYTYLTANAALGATSITVNSNAMSGGVFGGNLAAGDLILIVQMQGATMNNDPQFTAGGPPATSGYSVPNGFTWNNNWFDHAEMWGSIANDFGANGFGAYNNAGKFEQVEVLSTSGGNVINLQCGLRNNYTAAGHVQVVRVPRFNNLTVSGGLNRIVPTLWNGDVGGVVAIEVTQTLNIAAGSSISASGFGFRGGVVDPTGTAGSNSPANLQNVTFLGAPAAAEGSEKGEGIAGYTTEYIAIGSRYGISAPANGGGGGGYQNSGGGGGSNIYTGVLPYRGTGVPDQGPGGIYTPAWNVDISLPPFPNPDIANPGTPHLNFLPIGTTTSPGGGRGGYSLAVTDQNELVVGPRSTLWGGDSRKSNGGLGGHPLPYDATRVYSGGGGGAGDQDSGEGGSGGRGGGLVFITNYGTITGSGIIEANGAAGQNSNPLGGATSGGNPVRGEDGAGGGGAGGSIYIQNAAAIPATINLNAIGGNGGNMALLLSLPGTQPDEASGPGGSGAGGAIAFTSGTPTQNVSAGNNGVVTTNDPTPMMANFPPNGATRGFAGVSSLSTPFYNLIPTNATICAGNTANVSVAVVGTLPGPVSNVLWYTQQFGGSSFNSGLTYTTPPLGATTTYYVGVCPGTFRVPVVVTVNPLDNASFSYGAASYCQNGTDPTPTITGLAGGTFTSAPAGLSINAATGLIDVSASTAGAYTVTYTTNGPCPNSSNVALTIAALDNASFNYSAGSYCVSAADPTPTITGLSGGTFTSAPAGLVISALTGLIDVSASTPGAYTVTYTTAGACPNSSNVPLTITAVDNASFNYSAASYCVSGADPTPTITGVTGGGFTSAPAGLSINAATGTIDVSASTPGAYTVTYTTVGACANSSNVAVTITALDNASFSYGAASYCVTNADPTPTITGVAGGTFTSAPAGLVISAATGLIDVSASTPGAYTVTYTTVGTCSNSSNQAVTILATQNPAFTLTATCFGGTATITGTPGGTFSFNPAPGDGAIINAGTGAVTNGNIGTTYFVQYTTPGPCPASLTQSVTAATTLSYTAVITNENCGAGDGQIVLTASNGSGAPYQYSITGGAPYSLSGTFGSLSAGAFAISILDNSGCEVTGTENISSVGGLTVTNTVITNPSCAGVCDGAITVTISGGTLPYTYQWYNGVTPIGTNSPTITGLCAGNYSVQVTDASGGTITVYDEDFEAGLGGWTLNVATGANGATPNVWEVNDTEGGVAPSGCGVGGNGDETLHITCTSLFCGSFITGAVYNATQTSNYRAESPVFSTVGFTGLTLTFDYIANGDALLDNASLYYNAGSGWTILDPSLKSPICGSGQGQWTAYSIALPAICDNNPTVQIGYNWTNNADNIGTDPSIAVNNIVISAPGGSGCPTVANMTLNNLPSPTISGNAPVCVSATVQLTGSGTPNATTPWSSSNAGVATVSNTGLVTGVSGGTATITYTTTSGCQTTVVVTVNPLPTISGNAPICVGATVQLTGSGAPDPTTPWTSSNGAVATVSNTGLVTGVAAGSATITYEDANGCQNTVVVTVNALPTISGNIPICIGTTLQLTGSGTPNGTTPWVSSNTGVATISNTGLVTGVTAGSSTITYTNSNGCQITAVVTVAPNPVINTAQTPLTACNSNNGTITVSDATNSTGTVTWTGTASGSAVGVTLPYTITALAAGTYDVTFTSLGTGCTSAVSQQILANPGAPVINPIADYTSCNTNFTLLNANITGTGLSGSQAYYTATGGPTGLGTLIPNGTVYAAPTNVTIYAYDINGSCNTEDFFTVVIYGNPSISGNAPVCIGSTVQLTGAGTANAVTPWTSSNPGVATVSNTGLVTGVSAGASTITYTDNNGCQNTVSVTVNALPTIGGNAPVCAGNTVQLTGSGTPDPVTPWTTSNAGVATVNNTGLVTAVSAGSATITYEDVNGCQNTVLVTVSPAPTVSGNGPLCVGGTLQLTGSGTPDPVTPWVSLSPAIATVSNTGLVTGLAPGNVDITYTNSAGCSQTITVTVSVGATISGNAPICLGETLQLTGSGTPSATTPWASSNPAVATVNSSGLVTSVSPGSTVIAYMEAGGCLTNVTVVVNALPVINSTQTPLTACNSNDGIISVSGGAATGTVTWSGSASGSAVGVTLPYNITGLAAGTYDVTFTNTTTGCTSTATQQILLNPGAPIVNDLADQTVCDQYVLPTITGSGLTGNEAYWTGAGGTGTQFFAGDLISATTTLFIYDVSGSCDAEQSVVITVNQTPVMSPIADVSACGSYSLVAIQGTNLSGNEAYYDDSQANGGSPISGVITSTQTVWMYDENGNCSDEQSFLVTINPIPQVNSMTGGANYCQGDVIADILVDVTGSASWTLDYTLDGVAQSVTGGSSPLSLGNTPGVYVLVSLSDAFCAGLVSGTQTIVINPIPAAPVAGTDATYCSTAVFSDMTASGTGGTYTWYSDASLTNVVGFGAGLEPTAVEGVSTYYVTETLNGCESPASQVVITIENCDIIVPTAFTPDGDLVNDAWEILYLDQNFPNNIIQVYNRWGSLIYEHNSSASNPYNMSMWDGTYQGTDLPVASYFFIIDFNDGATEPMKGTVSIIRNE